MSREFCRDVPDPCTCSKSLCKKVRVHFSFPTKVALKSPQKRLVDRKVTQSDFSGQAVIVGVAFRVALVDTPKVIC